MLDVKRIPDEIFEIMQAFHSIDSESCVLAGGAPRDLILGGNIGDWDFFINAQKVGYEGPRAIQYRAALQRLGYTRTSSSPHDSGEYDDTGYEVETWRLAGVPAMEAVQLIFAPWGTVHDGNLALLKTFDISTCQVGINLDGDLFMTRDFQKAVEYKYHTVFMRNFRSQRQAMLGLFNHLPRIMKKYVWNCFVDYRDMDPEVVHNLTRKDSYIIPF